MCVCACVCACVCVEVKYSLCGVCEAVCQGGRREGERKSRWTAALLYCVHIYFLLLSLFIFYLLSVSHPPCFPLNLFSLMSSSFHSFFFTLLFFLFFPLSASVVLWQMAAWGSSSRAEARVWAGDEGRGDGGCGGKRRRRKEVGVRHMESLVKGPPQRECVCACGSPMNRGGVKAGYNGCPLRQRIDSNRWRRGEVDRQISRQTWRRVQRKTWTWCFFKPFFLQNKTQLSQLLFSSLLQLLFRQTFHYSCGELALLSIKKKQPQPVKAELGIPIFWQLQIHKVIM